MSSRAASRFESLGFSKVYDYLPSKMDWVAAGLPLEGASVSSATVIATVNRDTVTCTLDERLGDVAARAKAANTDACIVVSPEEIVLG